MRSRFLVILMLIGVLIPIGRIFSQSTGYDISGWAETYLPVLKASFKNPTSWKKTETRDGVYFTANLAPDNYGRMQQSMIAIANIESPSDVENYVKAINSGNLQKNRTVNYTYYETESESKGERKLHIYIEVEKDKRYIACFLLPYSSDPSLKNIETQFRALVETFKLDNAPTIKKEKKADDKIQLRGNWKVD